MPDAKTPFRFWHFFFSPHGRVSRLPFAVFVVGSQGLIETLALINGLLRQGLAGENQWWVYTMLGMAKFLLVWPQFAALSKRLHDLGWTFLPALAWFLPIAGSIGITVWHMRRVASPLMTPSSPDVMIDIYAGLVLSVLNLVLLLAAVIASIIPGTKGPNRFGPDPRHLSPADVF